MRVLDHCPACGSETTTFLWATPRDAHQRTWDLSRCTTCTHAFVNPQPSWEELCPYYPDEYDNYSPTHGSTVVDSDELIATARKIGVLRHAPIVEGTRLLDVGCGGGGFLHSAVKLGALVKGVEPSEHGASQASNRGLDVFCGTVEEYAQSAAAHKFDVITMSHALEHVPEPMKTLAAMRNLLARGGVVVVAMPNAGYWAWSVMKQGWIGMDVPRHLMHFSLDSLTRCAESAGFAVESMKTSCEPHAVALSLRLLLRRRFLIPWKVTAQLGFIIRPLARKLAERWDARNKGEALVAHLRVPAAEISD